MPCFLADFTCSSHRLRRGQPWQPLAWAKQLLAAASAQRQSLLMLSRGLEGYVLHSELLGDLGALLGKVVPSNEMLGNLQRLTLKRGR